MTFELPVTLEIDLSFGALTHNGLGPPPFIVPIPTASIEVPATMRHEPGNLLNKNKLSSTVTFNDLSIVLDGHDLGPFTLDITPVPPSNAWYLVMWPGASRKTVFSAAKVIVDKTPVAGTKLSPPIPLVTCGEPLSLPVAVCLTNDLHNCIIGFELSDLAAGFVSIVAAIAIDAVTAFVGAKISPAAQPGTVHVDRLWRQIYIPEIISKVVGFNNVGGVIKFAIAPLIEGGLSYARGQINGTGDWSMKWSLGGPFAGAELGYTGSRDAAQAGWGAQVSYGHVQRSYSFNTHTWSEQRAGVAVPDAPAAPTTPCISRPRPQGGSR